MMNCKSVSSNFATFVRNMHVRQRLPIFYEQILRNPGSNNNFITLFFKVSFYSRREGVCTAACVCEGVGDGGGVYSMPEARCNVSTA